MGRMAQNLLLEGRVAGMPYFTDMRAVFEAFPGVCQDYDWLISDLDCTWCARDGESDPADEAFRSGSLAISGHELGRFLDRNDIQFVWAVFSALPKGVKPAVDELPFAEGNPSFWKGSPKSQLPQSIFEIVCFDSTCTLLIGIDTELAGRFKAKFPEATDLDDFNRTSQ